MPVPGEWPAGQETGNTERVTFSPECARGHCLWPVLAGGPAVPDSTELLLASPDLSPGSQSTGCVLLHLVCSVCRCDCFSALPFTGLGQNTPDLSLATWVVLPSAPTRAAWLKSCRLTRGPTHASSQGATSRASHPAGEASGIHDSQSTAEAQNGTETDPREILLHSRVLKTSGKKIKSSLQKRKNMIGLRSQATMEGTCS